MRRLIRAIGWIAALCVLASVVWLAGAFATNRAVEIVADELARNGWQVELADTATTGFPDRLETRIMELRATAPEGGVLWHFPSLGISNAIARPGRITVTPDPGSSILDFPYLYVAQSSAAVIDIRPWPPFSLRELTWEAVGLSARSIGFPTFTAAQADARFAEGDDGQYTLHADLVGLDLPDAPPVSEISLDIAPEFTEPLAALSDAIELRRLQVREVRMVWGDVVLQGAGTLMVRADGRIEGQLDLTLDNWQGLLDQCLGAGILTEDAHAQWMDEARLLAAQSAGTDRIELPLVFGNAMVFLGPFPLGPAPQLY